MNDVLALFVTFLLRNNSWSIQGINEDNAQLKQDELKGYA